MFLMLRQCVSEGAILHASGDFYGRFVLKHAIQIVLASALWMAGPAFALADSTVNVSLEDASEGGSLAGMKMTATPDSVKAGRITIQATNKSQAVGEPHQTMCGNHDDTPPPKSHL
jgi:hypothetical protein